jgi:hypothetical protein
MRENAHWIGPVLHLLELTLLVLAGVAKTMLIMLREEERAINLNCIFGDVRSLKRRKKLFGWKNWGELCTFYTSKWKSKSVFCSDPVNINLISVSTTSKWDINWGLLQEYKHWSDPQKNVSGTKMKRRRVVAFNIPNLDTSSAAGFFDTGTSPL